MSQVHTFFCASCNVRYDDAPVRTAEVGERGCPSCGGTVMMVAAHVLEETLMSKTDFFDGDTRVFAPASSVQDDLLGKSLHVYDCERLLGAGGMGRVYLAKHRDLDRRCALKILSPQIADGDVDFVRRFLHEGKAAAALVHQNIVTVHAIGEVDGHHFLEMEFVPGRSLSQALRSEGKLGPVRSTVLAAEIAAGLAAAHREGVVHRDLKADNILLTPRGRAKIADFGLAKRVIDDDGVPNERIVGTPHYMAPELFNGEPSHPGSDVYALGVCYFQMLTGRYPFSGANLASIRKAILTEPFPNVREIIPEVPLEMGECVAKLTEKSPKNRPKDATEAAQMLQVVLGGLRDIETLLFEAFDGDPNAPWQRDDPPGSGAGSRYRVDLSLPDGRGQKVYLEATGDVATERLLVIYSTCCEETPDYYEQALRLNNEIPHGGLAIREIDGVEYFVMIDTYPRGTVSADAIRRSVLEVGHRADAIELLLTGEDIH